MKDVELALWAQLISRSTASAMANLSVMIGTEISVGSFALRQVALDKVARLVGGPETLTVGIYLTVSGSADGHIMLMYDPSIARSFVDLLLGQPVGVTHELGELEQSALGEMGNVVGSSFLNALADSVQLRLLPSPPTVMTDMAGALLDIIAADILLTQDEAFVADTTFCTADHEMSGTFFVMPGRSLMQAVALSMRAS